MQSRIIRNTRCTMNCEQPNVDDLLSSSEKCLVDGDFVQAVVFCSELISHGAHLERAYLIRAEANVNLCDREMESDDFEKIIEQVRSDTTIALELCPTDVVTMDRLAWYMKIKRRFDESVAILTEAIEIDPSRMMLYANRGNSHFCAHHFAEALEDYTRAIEIDPNTRNLFWFRGQTYARLQKFEHAILDFTRELASFPTSEVYADRGESYEQLGEYDLAIQDYTESLRLAPGDAAMYLNRSSCFVHKLDYDRAVEDLTQSIQIDPSEPSLFDCRAYCYIRLKEYERGLADCQSSIKLAPRRSEPYYLRAACYARMGNRLKATRAYRKARRMGATEMPLEMLFYDSSILSEFDISD